MSFEINQARSTRQISTLIIPAGKAASLVIGGDFFYIYSMSGALTVSVNGGDYSPAQSGLIHKGIVGRNDLGQIRFNNATVAAVTVVVIFGKGDMEISGQVSLSPADLAQVSPAPQIDTAGGVELANQVYTFPSGILKSITVVNTGAVNIICGGVPMIPGLSLTWSTFRPQDRLADFTVDSQGGGVATVAWLQ